MSSSSSCESGRSVAVQMSSSSAESGASGGQMASSRWTSWLAVASASELDSAIAGAGGCENCATGGDTGS